MNNSAVFATTFLASAVEIIEMVIIVVGVGAIRGWRSTLFGVAAGLLILAVLIAALGSAPARLPAGPWSASRAAPFSCWSALWCPVSEPSGRWRDSALTGRAKT